MILKTYLALLLFIFSKPIVALPEMPDMRPTFGVEYITPGVSPDHDYSVAMMSLGAEFKFKYNIHLVASGSFQRKGIPEGVEHK